MGNFTKPQPFFIDYKETYVHGDMLLEGKEPPAVLFLHGGMPQEDRTRFLLLRQILIKQSSLSSCAFDFIGHGGSSGDMQCSSLQDRTAQAAEIIYACFDCQPLSIVASGMGAYTALRLLPDFPVESLVLITPAVYSRIAYRVPFGDEFSRIIRVPRSWENTDAWEYMQDFKGDLGIIAASQDQVIPPDVLTHVGKYVSSSYDGKMLELCCPHDLMAFANSDPASLMRVARLIADIVAGSTD